MSSKEVAEKKVQMRCKPDGAIRVIPDPRSMNRAHTDGEIVGDYQFLRKHTHGGERFIEYEALEDTTTEQEGKGEG